MIIRRFLLLCALCGSLAAQTLTFPALSTNNVFTGINSFTQLTPGMCMQAGTGGLLATTASPCAAGSVTQIATTSPILGGPISTTGTLSLATTAVTPGSYTNTNLTVDQWGRITAAANGSAGGGLTGSGTNGTVAEWTGASSLGNSGITDVGGGIYVFPTTGSIRLFQNPVNSGSPGNPPIRLTALNNLTTSIGTRISGGSIRVSNNPQNTSGTVTTTNVYGLEVLADNAGSTAGGNGNVTTLNGLFVATGEGGAGGQTNGLGTTAAQNGIQIIAVNETGAATITTNKGISLQTGGLAGDGTTITNDYGLYVETVSESKTNSNIAHHSGIYIDDQGQGNSTANIWYALNIAPQSNGFGDNLPTPLINLGGVLFYGGPGVPSFNCGSTPSVWWRNDATTASTVEYVCVSGTTWTAVAVP